MNSDQLSPADDHNPGDDPSEASAAGAWTPGEAEPTVDGEIVESAAAAPESEAAASPESAAAASPEPGWGHTWPPPPPSPPGVEAGGWSGHVPGGGPPLVAASPRKRHGLPVAVAAGLVAAAVAAGVGIGHTLWTTPAVKASAAATTPNGANAGQGGNPYSGQNPYGSQSPFSNGGASSGNGSSGSTSTGSGGPANVSAIAGKIDPALVDINVEFQYQSSGGAGTGIVLTSNGEILTNNHVINGATSISATDIGNGKTYSATVVGYDPVHDLAVLQLQNASGLQTASLADSSKVAVGDQVVAVGNAGGTRHPDRGRRRRHRPQPKHHRQRRAQRDQ